MPWKKWLFKEACNGRRLRAGQGQEIAEGRGSFFSARFALGFLLLTVASSYLEEKFSRHQRGSGKRRDISQETMSASATLSGELWFHKGSSTDRLKY